MAKTLTFNSGSLGIGADAGPFTIFHTSKNEVNKLADQVTKNDLDGGYSVSGVDDSKFTFVIYESGSGNLQTIYLPKPTITGFSPSSGETGDTIQITGSGFVGATAVTFGSISATSFNYKSNTSMSAVVAGGETGFIKVTNPRGTTTSTQIFTYKTAPSVTVYYLGEYYYDLNDSSIVCGMSTLSIYPLYSEDAQSLQEALSSGATIYINPTLVDKAPSGYYGVQVATYPGNDEDQWYFIDVQGTVNGSGECSGPPPERGGKGEIPEDDGGEELVSEF